MYENISSAVSGSVTVLKTAWENLPEKDKASIKPVLDLICNSVHVPASSSVSRHGGFDGGIIVHTTNVYEFSMALFGGGTNAFTLQHELERRLKAPFPVCLDPAALQEQLEHVTPTTIFRAALIHDLHKIQNLRGEPYYIPNILSKGNRSTAKPWEISLLGKLVTLLRGVLGDLPSETYPTAALRGLLDEGGISYREGLLSLATAYSISPDLEQDLSQTEKDAVIFHDGAYAGRTGIRESLLQQIIHTADMIASRYAS